MRDLTKPLELDAIFTPAPDTHGYTVGQLAEELQAILAHDPSMADTQLRVQDAADTYHDELLGATLRGMTDGSTGETTMFFSLVPKQLFPTRQHELVMGTLREVFTGRYTHRLYQPLGRWLLAQDAVTASNYLVDFARVLATGPDRYLADSSVVELVAKEDGLRAHRAGMVSYR